MIDEMSKDSEIQGPRVFISYSRADLDEAEKISAELTKRGHAVSRDLDDILPTEEWKGRLEKLIAEADVVVFLLNMIGTHESPRCNNTNIYTYLIHLFQ